MARPKINTTVERALSDLKKLENYINSMNDVELKFQSFIAQLVMMRQYDVLELAIAEIAYKLCTGSQYLNGNNPNLITRPAPSIKTAREQMCSFNRTKYRQLRWSRSKEIKCNIENIMDLTDYYVQKIEIHASLLCEMSKVRNFIAHNNASARKKYKEVIKDIYSADLKLGVGAFLISTKRHSIPNLERYIKFSRIMIKEIASGNI